MTRVLEQAAPAIPGPHRPGTVVVGFDGSAPAWPALYWAAAEAVGTGRRLQVLSVIRWPQPELGGLRLPPGVGDLDRTRRTATASLGAAAAHCREAFPGVHVTPAVVRGTPVDVLSQLAMESGLLVLGASGQTAAAQVLLGSSAAEVLRRVTTTVVVVRGVPTHRRGTAGRVVVGVDTSPDGDRALGHAMAVAARRGCEVVAVHACLDLPLAALAGSEDVDQGRLRADGAALLAARLLAVRETYPHVLVHPVVTIDHPAQALLDHAAGADLVVVGRKGRARTSGAAPGSVTHAVAHYAPCPVAVVGES
jgi:nucleotide-binding universal stress UspA family protein